jgi:GNAT superfamily N-acetyltransferase
MTIFPPDDRLSVAAPDGSGTAQCALWWRTPPSYRQERVGLIGAYRATSAGASDLLLQQACTRLARVGCTLAIGPLDGSTWDHYRFVVETSDTPPFFMEPQNPREYPQQFQAAGFAPLALYSSALMPDLTQLAPIQESEQKQERLMARGIRVRQVSPADITDPQRFDALLQRVYPVVCTAFKHNLLYQPISAADFCAHYRPLQPALHPDLLWLAEHDGTLIGFLLALPDHARTPIDTVLLKTLAVLPAYTGQGIGTLLCNLCQHHAAAQGLRRAIYALRQTGNSSERINASVLQVIRHYALFGRRLDA